MLLTLLQRTGSLAILRRFWKLLGVGITWTLLGRPLAACFLEVNREPARSETVERRDMQTASITSPRAILMDGTIAFFFHFTSSFSFERLRTMWTIDNRRMLTRKKGIYALHSMALLMLGGRG